MISAGVSNIRKSFSTLLKQSLKVFAKPTSLFMTLFFVIKEKDYFW